jgi:long-chain fatty acid transport protein
MWGVGQDKEVEMKQGVRWVFWTLLVFSLGLGAWASGTLVEEQGSRASAQGGAFVARADDASALFYNPAGLAFQQTSFMSGFSFINSHMKYDGPAGNTVAPEKTYWPLYMYFNYRTPGAVSFGVGMYAPHALATEWDADWAGSAIAKRTLQKAIYTTPTMSWRLGDKWAIGVTANFVHSTIYLRQSVFFPSIPYPVPPLNRTPDPAMGVLDGTASGVGWGLGVLYKPSKHWQIGLNFRDRINMKYTGELKFYRIPTNPDFTPMFPRTRAGGDIVLPRVYTLGAAYMADKWSLELDVTRQEWSVFETMALNFWPNHGQVQDKIVPQYWNDIYKYKVGFEYRWSKKWSYGLGYFYDESPVPDKYAAPLLPDSNRNGFTGGINWQGRKFGVQSYLMYLPFQTKHVPADTPFIPGTYKAHAYLGGLSVSYKF